MAVIKHIAIKNSNYTAAVEYLTYKHDEFTSKPILDEQGRMMLRDEYLIDGINCTPQSYGLDCSLTNRQYGKNQDQKEIKAHHYIISFDPRDRDENGLTPQRAQELGMAFADNYFPGHQVLVCTHPDGHGNAGNIHVHIVLNSVRAFDVPHQDFMERPGDALAGHKHHVTKDFLEFLKQQTMLMCQSEDLHQVNLLEPAKVRITDREYWAQRRGQHQLDAECITTGKPYLKYETRNMILRKQIMSTMLDSHSFDEFERKLLSNYGIVIQESRGQISYHVTDRAKPIRGKTLGTDFERAAIFRFFSIGRRIVSDDSIHAVSDVSLNEKAKTNQAYARVIKTENLKQLAKTKIYIDEHGLSEEEINERYATAKHDYDELTAQRKAIEAEINKLKKVDYALKQYYETKSIFSQYRYAKDKKAFREMHSTELTIYDAARKELRAIYGKEKFPSRKQVRSERTALQSQYHNVYEDFCAARSRYYESRDIRINYHEMTGQELPTPDRESDNTRPL